MPRSPDRGSSSRAEQSGPPRRTTRAPLVEMMGPPVARSPWSNEFAIQAIEVLPVFLELGSPMWLKPLHADSLVVGLPKSSKAVDVVLDVIGWYPLRPQVVHSTSWRETAERVILTYLVVIERPDGLPADSLVSLPVARTHLARAEAMAAPASIPVAAVIEHAFRHLKWLLGDDPAVAGALPEWREVLTGYVPEPFRAL